MTALVDLSHPLERGPFDSSLNPRIRTWVTAPSRFSEGKGFR